MLHKNVKKPIILPEPLIPDDFSVFDHLIRGDSPSPTKIKIHGYYPGKNLLTGRNIKRQHNFSPDFWLERGFKTPVGAYSPKRLFPTSGSRSVTSRATPYLSKQQSSAVKTRGFPVRQNLQKVRQWLRLKRYHPDAQVPDLVSEKVSKNETVLSQNQSTSEVKLTLKIKSPLQARRLVHTPVIRRMKTQQTLVPPPSAIGQSRQGNRNLSPW